MRQQHLRNVIVDESPLRVLVDQIPALFWTTDEELRFTCSLGAGLARVGLGPNQVVGMSLSDLLSEGSVRAHRRALRGESVVYRMEWAGREFHSRVGPLRDSEGHPIGTICVALDVDEPHREEWRFAASG